VGGIVSASDYFRSRRRQHRPQEGLKGKRKKSVEEMCEIDSWDVIQVHRRAHRVIETLLSLSVGLHCPAVENLVAPTTSLLSPSGPKERRRPLQRGVLFLRKPSKPPAYDQDPYTCRPRAMGRLLAPLSRLHLHASPRDPGASTGARSRKVFDS
jgi:hypothetical protein